jgi:hypothetical protein
MNLLSLEFAHVYDPKRYFECQKTEKSGLQASQGSCPLLTILATFSLEIGSGSPLPLI